MATIALAGVGKSHAWISIVVGAITQGPVADALKCLPSIADVITTVYARTARLLTEDTQTNEAYAMRLIQK